MRVSQNKKFGYILIPIIVDLNNKDLTTSAYQQIVDTIVALGMNDSRIIASLVFCKKIFLNITFRKIYHVISDLCLCN